MFSEGERQLISLCRAFLSGGGREALKLLLCDEPTSNVDLALDHAVHNALLSEPITLLMICHRLQHIGGFDRVMMLDQGKVVEDGPPARLLSESTSRLCVMCEQVGLSAEAIIGGVLQNEGSRARRKIEMPEEVEIKNPSEGECKQQ